MPFDPNEATTNGSQAFRIASEILGPVEFLCIGICVSVSIKDSNFDIFLYQENKYDTFLHVIAVYFINI